MPKANKELVAVLRKTARKLENPSIKYEWGHMGRCNCGHLVQVMTEMTDVEIARSIGHEVDEWSEHAVDYCPGTGQKIEDLFETMKKIGFSPNDAAHLEHLSDKKVLEALQGGKRYLRKNVVEDVSLYMNTMADLLERELEASFVSGSV